MEKKFPFADSMTTARLTRCTSPVPPSLQSEKRPICLNNQPPNFNLSFRRSEDRKKQGVFSAPKNDIPECTVVCGISISFRACHLLHRFGGSNKFF